MSEFLSVKEIAAKLQVHYNTIYNLVRTGQIKSIRIGSKWKILESDVEEYIKRNTENSIKREDNNVTNR